MRKHQITLRSLLLVTGISPACIYIAVFLASIDYSFVLIPLIAAWVLTALVAFVIWWEASQ